MKKPMYAERTCYAWGEMKNVSDNPPAHNEPGRVWRVRVADEREPTARQAVATMVTAMRNMKELDGISDQGLCDLAWRETGMSVEICGGRAVVRGSAPAPHKWKAGDKFTLPDAADPKRVYRVHRTKGRTVWYLWDAYGYGDLPRGALSRAGPDRTKMWKPLPWCG